MLYLLTVYDILFSMEMVIFFFRPVRIFPYDYWEIHRQESENSHQHKKRYGTSLVQCGSRNPMKGTRRTGFCSCTHTHTHTRMHIHMHKSAKISTEISIIQWYLKKLNLKTISIAYFGVYYKGCVCVCMFKKRHT